MKKLNLLVLSLFAFAMLSAFTFADNKTGNQTITQTINETFNETGTNITWSNETGNIDTNQTLEQNQTVDNNQTIDLNQSINQTGNQTFNDTLDVNDTMDLNGTIDLNQTETNQSSNETQSNETNTEPEVSALIDLCGDNLPTITPNNGFLWGLKRAIENIDYSLTFGKSAKAKKGLAHARERLCEVQRMIQQKKLDKIEKAKNAYEDSLTRTEEDLADVEDSKDVKEMESELNRHKYVIENIEVKIKGKDQLTEEQQKKLDELILSFNNSATKTKIEVEAKKGKLEIQIKAQEAKERVEKEKNNEHEGDEVNDSANIEHENNKDHDRNNKGTEHDDKDNEDEDNNENSYDGDDSGKDNLNKITVNAVSRRNNRKNED